MTKLTPRLAQELDALIEAGWYANRSEAVRDAVRDLVERQRLRRLETAVEEDIDGVSIVPEHRPSLVAVADAGPVLHLAEIGHPAPWKLFKNAPTPDPIHAEVIFWKQSLAARRITVEAGVKRLAEQWGVEQGLSLNDACVPALARHRKIERPYGRLGNSGNGVGCY